MTPEAPWRPDLPDALATQTEYETDIWLVVVDDDEDSGNVVADHLPNLHVFSFTDVDEAARFLAYDRSLRPLALELPEPLAVIVLVDLWMGGPTGLDTLSVLRQVEQIPIYPILRSNGTDGGRELLAVAAAEVWGHGKPTPGIHYMPKQFRTFRWAQDFQPCIDAVRDAAFAATYSTGANNSVNALGPISTELLWIRPLTIVPHKGRDTTLLRWLAKPEWQLAYLRRLTLGDNAPQARLNSGAPKTFRDIAKTLGPLIHAHNRASPNGSWLEHEGRLSFADVELGEYDTDRAGDHKTFIAEFAGRERFMFASTTLPDIIAELDV